MNRGRRSSRTPAAGRTTARKTDQTLPSSKQRKRPSDSTSAKRQRTGKTKATKSLTTPYIHALSGANYLYHHEDVKGYFVYQLTPLEKFPIHEDLPMSLASSARSFCEGQPEVLIGPDHIVLMYKLNPAHSKTHNQFLVGLFKSNLPNMDQKFLCSRTTMDKLLLPFLTKAGVPELLQLQRESGDQERDSDSSVSDLDMLSDSSWAEDDEMPEDTEAYNPVPPWSRTSNDAPAKRTAAAPVTTGHKPTATTVELQEEIQATPKAAKETAAPAQPGKVATSSQPTSSLQNDDMEAQATTSQQPATLPSPKPARVQKTRYRAIDFTKLEVPVTMPPPVQTALIRPANQKDNLQKVNSFKLFNEIKKIAGEPQRIRDIRDGGVAVDFLPETSLDALLQATTIMQISVKVALPRATTPETNGVITSLHWEITEEEIIQELRTEPATTIVKAKRLAKPGVQSWTVKLTFEGDICPTRAYLAGRSYKVKPFIERPLQCFRCARFGHVATLCKSSAQKCWICAQNHETKDCANRESPVCGNCNGKHQANSQECPTWSFQRKVQEVKKSNQVTFKTARGAVESAARSYAAAVKAAPKTNTAPQPIQTANFKPNVANHQPPQEPETTKMLGHLVQTLLQLLTNAAATGDVQGAIRQAVLLLQSVVPGEP